MKRKGNNSNEELSKKRQKTGTNSIYIEHQIKFDSPNQIIDITKDVEKRISENDIKDGLCLITSIDPTVSVFVQLDDEKVIETIKNWIETKMVPKELKNVHEKAKMYFKRTLLKKEVLLSVMKEGLFLQGEHVYTCGFEKIDTKLVIVIIGTKESGSFYQSLQKRNVTNTYDLTNVSHHISSVVSKSKITEGICLVNSLDPRETIFINDDESGLHSDYNKWQKKFTENYKYPNILKRVMMGREVSVCVYNGRLHFGPWEQIFFGEFGRQEKRSTEYLVKIVGGKDLKFFKKEMWFNTDNRFHCVNITNAVEGCLKESNIKDGICLINSMHITSGTNVGNWDDKTLHKDFFNWIEYLAPEKPHKYYRHNGYETNGDAHHKRQIISRQTIIPVHESKLIMGKDLKVFYCECDGNRRKRCLITLLGIE